MRCLYFIFLFHFSQLGDRVCGGPIILGTDFNAETHEPPRDNLDVWLDVLRRLRQGGWSEEEIKGIVERNVAMDGAMLPHETYPSQAVTRFCREAGLNSSGRDCADIRRAFYAQCREKLKPGHSDGRALQQADFLDMPPLAFGMGLLMDWGDAVPWDEETAVLALDALQMGFRHIDSAEMYGNDRELGVALQRFYQSSGLQREDVWITHKLQHSMFEAEKGCREILERLGTEYIDLLLLHMPVSVAARQRGIGEHKERQLLVSRVWRDMERLVEAGLVRHIGVSNHGEKHLQELLYSDLDDDEVGVYLPQIRPYANQVEFNPFLQQRSLVALCAREHIHLMAFSVMAPLTEWRGQYGLEALLSRLAVAAELNLTASVGHSHHSSSGNQGSSISPSQVLLRYVQQKGFAAVVASRNRTRLLDHLATLCLPPSVAAAPAVVKNCHRFSLSPEDITRIDILGKDRVLRMHRNGEIFGDSCHLTLVFPLPTASSTDANANAIAASASSSHSLEGRVEGGTRFRLVNAKEGQVREEVERVLREERGAAAAAAAPESFDADVNHLVGLFDACFESMRVATGHLIKSNQISDK